MIDSRHETTPPNTPPNLNSDRMAILNERVLRELEDRMLKMTDDENWVTPTQAAIDLGLHYIYVAHAMTCGEIDTAVQAVSTATGKKNLVVVSTSQVQAWYDVAEAESQADGKSIQEVLAARYHMTGPVRMSNGDPEPDPDRPEDLISVPIAEQFLEQAGVPSEQLHGAIDRGSIRSYRFRNDDMVSESAIALLTRSPDCGETAAVRVEDTGPCTPDQAAERMGIDPELLNKAVSVGFCRAMVRGGHISVSLGDVAEWYETSSEEYPRKRFVVIMPKRDPSDETEEDVPVETNNHYGTPVTVSFLVPDVPNVVNNLSSRILERAVEFELTFVPADCVSISPDVAYVNVPIEISVGCLISISHYAHLSGRTLEDYVSLVAWHIKKS